MHVLMACNTLPICISAPSLNNVTIRIIFLPTNLILGMLTDDFAGVKTWQLFLNLKRNVRKNIHNFNFPSVYSGSDENMFFLSKRDKLMDRLSLWIFLLKIENSNLRSIPLWSASFSRVFPADKNWEFVDFTAFCVSFLLSDNSDEIRTNTVA